MDFWAPLLRNIRTATNHGSGLRIFPLVIVRVPVCSEIKSCKHTCQAEQQDTYGGRPSGTVGLLASPLPGAIGAFKPEEITTGTAMLTLFPIPGKGTFSCSIYYNSN